MVSDKWVRVVMATAEVSIPDLLATNQLTRALRTSDCSSDRKVVRRILKTCVSKSFVASNAVPFIRKAIQPTSKTKTRI